MFGKKREGYVTKSNRQMQAGRRLESYKTLEEGLNHYQGKVVQAICPYPTADSALLVVALRSAANSIIAGNPECEELAKEIVKRFEAPKLEQNKKTMTTKKR